jgi:ABC-2 type transport system ATP-binding protein
MTSPSNDPDQYPGPPPGRHSNHEPASAPPSGDGFAVEATGLVKHFTTRKQVTKAVDGIDLRIPTGTVFGLLGPNGAGKTTVVRMFATLLRPDAGTARVLGHDVVHDADAVRAAVGLTGQYASVDEDLTGTENLLMLARLYGFTGASARRRIEGLLEAFSLSDAGARQVKTYSGGMRRRIDLAASLVLAPRVLFLDEPTTGLDPRSRNQVWDIVRVLVEDGATVLLTTQYLEEADQLADRISVIDHGKVIAEGTTSELKRSVGQGAVDLRLADSARRAEAAEIVERLLGTSPPTRTRSARACPTTARTRSRTSCPRSPRPGSRSRSSRSASRAWTRCS